MKSKEPSELVLPYRKEAEQGVLSCLMHDLKGLPACQLDDADFHDSAHAAIFKVLKRIYARGTRKFELSLFILSMTKTELTLAGGKEYIKEVWGSQPYEHHLHFYAGFVQEDSLRRKLMTASMRATTQMAEGSVTATEAADQLISKARQCREKEFVNVLSANEIISRFGARFQESINQELKTSYLPGLPCCEANGLCFVPSELSIIAARPSVGKSAFAKHCARSLAKQGVPTLFISLEMSEEELGARIALPLAGINNNRVRMGDIRPDDVQKINQAAVSTEGLPFYSWCPTKATVEDIENIVTLSVERRGVKVVFVDYLQFIDYPRNSMLSEHEQIGINTKALKRLGKQHKIPMVVLSQLNRQVSEFERPTKAHLRASGSIEQDADAIFFLWIKEERPLDDMNLLGFCTDKNRQGGKGSRETTLALQLSTGKFYDPKATEPEPQGELF